MTEKMAEVAPIPRARVPMVTTENVRFLESTRAASRRCLQSRSIIFIPL